MSVRDTRRKVEIISRHGCHLCEVALEELNSIRREVDFELIENMDNDYVLERMKRADIVIDQPGIWVARAAVEAMASGCCVIGGNRSVYMQRFDSPAIQFEPDVDQLAAVLKDLILDQDARQKKMNECFIVIVLGMVMVAFICNLFDL